MTARIIETAQLLFPFDFTDLDVLELGPARTPVSKHLAEQARSLTFLRVDQLKIDPFEPASRLAIDPKENFDVVCLVGALEALPDAAAVPSLLKRASTYLRPEGVLIVAAQNRLGMRFWSGSPEPKSQLLFEGVTGGALSGYSRKELNDALAALELEERHEFFPFPDHQGATCVLSRELLEKNSELVADIAGLKPFHLEGEARVTYFPEALALHSVARAGMLAEFSNSFLFLASREKTSATLAKLTEGRRERGEVGWHYSLNRKVPTQTVFRLHARGGELDRTQLWVEKQTRVRANTATGVPSPADTKFSSDHLVVSWNPGNATPVAEGEKLRIRLLKLAYAGQWRQFRQELEAFLMWSFRRFEVDRSFLSGRALDALFTNAVGGGASFEVFDLEWVLEEMMPRGWFIFRNLCAFWPDLDAFTGDVPFRTLADLYVQLCEHFVVKPDFEGDLAKEAELQTLLVRGRSKVEHLRALQELFLRKLDGAGMPRSARAEADFQSLKRRLALGKITPKLRGLYHTVKKLGKS